MVDCAALVCGGSPSRILLGGCALSIIIGAHRSMVGKSPSKVCG
jgi:hypothetical protein